MFNLFRKGNNMSILEQGVQSLIIEALKEVEEHHAEIIKLVSLGKLDAVAAERINTRIVWILRTIHPLFDVAHSLIPEGSPLHKTMDWCQEIYHQVFEPGLK